MNLNFSEMDNLGDNNFDVDNYQSNNYWESSNTQAQIPEQTKVQKKKFNYDDILNSLNMVVNKNGVLQYMTTNASQEEQEQQTTKQIKAKPLEPQVKNSHIYNKYFKDYKDPNTEIVQNVRVPKTIEEYKRMLLEDRIKRIRERNRIAQIKTTKMLFESNNINNGFINNTNHNQKIGASKNTLRMMNFK